MKRKISLIISVITFLVLITSAVVIAFIKYIVDNFADSSIDEMIFYMISGMNGAASDVFITGIKTSIVPFLLILILLLLPIIRLKKRKNVIEIKFRNKKFEIHFFPIKFLYKYRLIYACILLFVSLLTSYKILGVDNYINRLNEYSTLMDDYYVSGTDVSITFPNEKRNLIILYLESVENSLIDKDNGGGWEYSVIPELENIAQNNLNFSNSDKIGGAHPITGTTWTVGALVATTSGIPLKIPINGNEYTSSENFLAGAYTLGDVLKNEGYNLELMFGSDANFGGRKNYYTYHGDYKIFDVNTAIQEGKMLESEQVWWGFDDSHLFEWAKEEIISLASSDEPFNFTFLTANTHFPNGYLESSAETKFESQYENVFAHSSKQVDEFVKWFEEQDFYNNTTLVILGDHLSMQTEFFSSNIYEGYSRTMYNAFINSSIEPVNAKNRTFSSLDFYPTILGSIGVEIEGNRLGLGTNLFSERETLVEELGFSFVNSELSKNSSFYNRNILQGDYLDLLKKAEQGNQE
ncbi:phosphoglycerol transferase [Salirhabdus euzebyi]|uniref:Phosphoglycerol transferase n=1 Tax=Salirhabdus euzebyi TaxID=394506 RepID=A0A841Q7X0_9BACI|nr:LTA synthase family protein [Salirhabdus euzebyi]MBB6454520.1 phosphoglycerol transferase [Salirhabdus euzebyi]